MATVEAIGVAAKRVIGENYAVENRVYVPHRLELFSVDQMGGGRLVVGEGGRTSYGTLYEITPKGMPELRNRRTRLPDDMQTVMSVFDRQGSSAEEAEVPARH